jgi:hypothetical protein
MSFKGRDIDLEAIFRGHIKGDDEVQKWFCEWSKWQFSLILSNQEILKEISRFYGSGIEYLQELWRGKGDSRDGCGCDKFCWWFISDHVFPSLFNFLN